jgi:O-succinylbenzoate synthase
VAEFAPLPPFSEESMEDVMAQLPDIAHWMETWVPFESPDKAEAAIPKTWAASVRWGVSGMIGGHHSAITQKRGTPKPLHVHTLLPPGTKSAFKVKIHPDSWEPLLNILKAHQEEHPEARWVVDVNEKGSLQWLHDLNSWCTKHKFDALQYVEDPMVVRTPQEARSLIDQSPIKLGFDEFLQPRRRQETYGLNEGLESLKGAVCVLKPALFGTNSEVIYITSQAQKKGVPVVVSTLMESTIGRARAAEVAKSHGSTMYTHGLDTGHLFERDLGPSKGAIETTLEKLPVKPVVCYSKTPLT